MGLCFRLTLIAGQLVSAITVYCVLETFAMAENPAGDTGNQTGGAASADAREAASATAACDAKRPVILLNRWQEDWSMLSNPCVKTEPLDALKYMPFSSISDTYLSLGLDLRERIESNNSALFGLGGRNANTYLIQRAEVHADFRVDTHFQVFVQIEDARPFGKDSVTPLKRESVVKKWPLTCSASYRCGTDPT
jgi:hypothetical protein